MAGSSRGQGGKRGGGARSSKGYSSKREVGGRGIFVTCIRGKEGRCMDELLDVLDTVRLSFRHCRQHKVTRKLSPSFRRSRACSMPIVSILLNV